MDGNYAAIQAAHVVNNVGSGVQEEIKISRAYAGVRDQFFSGIPTRH